MGRSASHITLECALQTRPNICIICEEVQENRFNLSHITNQIADVICKRAEIGKNYGIVLLPEGLIEFIPEFSSLISEINDILATTPAEELSSEVDEKNNFSASHETDTSSSISSNIIASKLSPENSALFSQLPKNIKHEMLLDRDPHGNVQVTRIETETLIGHTVNLELERRRSEGKYSGIFLPQYHSFGYEGRSGLPSIFDSTYCYALGYNVAALVALGQNGLISSITNLHRPVSEWVCGGVPITMMCNIEKRSGKLKVLNIYLYYDEYTYRLLLFYIIISFNS
jgi:diphosphate--fructose-6-phosphate 1-phosphotransferase